ncbi:hypothetical protein [Amphritea pacifica]|uniref:hypothetical protein n=1 Tax=Amphritea pacifica TaxID=2811233 RepID=UPI001963BA06|nr:hypothetical protein [Amphritea pacifica]MBN1008453.1 hypothetical protein [Amphritea pacifica]
MTSEEIGAGMAEQLLGAVRNRVPVVDRVLRLSGGSPLSEYLQQVCQFSQQSYQPRSDIADVIYEYVAPLLGEKIAERTAADFLQHPVALTANHHGVDFFAQSVQGSLLFGLAKRQIEGVTTLPVFSCANIPLDNLTYPRGALLYACNRDAGSWPLRLPAFSNKYRRQLVARVKGLDRPMLQQLVKRVHDLMGHGIDAALLETLLELIETEYLSEDVLSQQGYAAQSVILNQRIWSRLFCSSASMPDLVTIELEKLAEGLFLKDLHSEASLVAQLFTDPLITAVCKRLDSVPGCWNQALLEQRWSHRGELEQLQTSGCGTFCFWGIDKRFRRIPLMLTEISGGLQLCGCDDNGEEYYFCFEPAALSQAIRDGRLLPSVFGCFLVIALARGVTCLGGYYQGDYLPQIQAGVVEVLQQNNLPELAAVIHDSVTDGYLSGMQTIMVEQGEFLLPAGLLEILASGSISVAEFEVILKMSLRDAHSASLTETVADVMPGVLQVENRLTQLLRSQREQLSEKITIRHL